MSSGATALDDASGPGVLPTTWYHDAMPKCRVSNLNLHHDRGESAGKLRQSSRLPSTI